MILKVYKDYNLSELKLYTLESEYFNIIKSTNIKDLIYSYKKPYTNAAEYFRRIYNHNKIYPITCNIMVDKNLIFYKKYNSIKEVEYDFMEYLIWH